MSGGTTFLGLPISPLSIARGTATLFGALGLTTGTLFILNPSQASTTFGFPPSSSISKSALSNPFIPVAGGRAVASGLTILGLSYLKDDRALGVLMMAGGVAGIVDGWTILRYTAIKQEGEGAKIRESGEEGKAAQGAAYGHWITISICVGIGAWLFLNGEG